MGDFVFSVSVFLLMAALAAVASMSTPTPRPAPPPSCQQRLRHLEKELIKVEILCRAMEMACTAKEEI